MQTFEWDEAKRLLNREKHGLDFLDAVTLFDNPHYVTQARPAGAELRWLAVGPVDGTMLTVVFTRREATIRIISLRKARRNERRRHQALHGG